MPARFPPVVHRRHVAGHVAHIERTFAMKNFDLIVKILLRHARGQVSYYARKENTISGLLTEDSDLCSCMVDTNDCYYLLRETKYSVNEAKNKLLHILFPLFL